MRFIAIDIETTGLKLFNRVIWSISLTEGKKTKLYHDCNGLKKCPPEVKLILEDETICKIIHSSQFDCPYIEMEWHIKIRNIWDTELDETVIQGMALNIKRKTVEPGSALWQMLKAHSTALDLVLARYKLPVPDKQQRSSFIDRPSGKKFIKPELSYMVDDTKSLPSLQKAQEFLLKRDGLLEVALLENKVAERYHDMKVRGIGFSSIIWRQIADAQLKEYNARLAKLPKVIDNWNSEKQVKKYFRSKGIEITTYNDLDKVYLQTRNKTLGDFINTRELSKAVSSYGHNWFEDGYIDPDNRIRCGVRQIINTARNAMFDPNLQQLPGSGNSDPLRLKVLELITGNKKQKPQHRRAFVPKPGHVFIINDFGGQEIGIMAAASDETLWINALLRGEDVHSLTASVINPVAWAEAREKGCTFPKKCQCAGHKKLREPAKINNFMLAYGGGPEKFADFVGIDKVAASAYVSAHKRVIPRLTAYLERNGRDAVNTGVSYSADPYRRRRVLKGEEEWQVRNQGKNNPIQSSGSNMLKLAMASTPWNIAIVLVIHDEIICEVPIKTAEKSALVLKSVMEKSADFITGIKGLIRVEPKIQMNIMKDLPITNKLSGIKSGEFCYLP